MLRSSMTAPPPAPTSSSAAQPPEDAPTSTDLGTLLRQPGYTPWWASRLLTQLASQMVMVALGWQMYELTASAWDLGLVGLLQFLPALALTLPAGHLADHHDRARIVFVTQLVQLAAAALLLAATHGAWVDRPLILGLSVLLGTARAFQMPASQSLTPQLVPAVLLPRAMAFNSSGIQAAIIGGPALAGALFAVGIDWVYALSVLGFVAATLMMRHVHPRPRDTAAGAGAGGAEDEGRWHAALAGVRFLWQRPTLLGAISLDLFAVLLGGATALLPMFVKDVLHAEPWVLGLLRAAPAAGALAMSVWLSHHPLERRIGRHLIASVAVYGLCMLGFGASTSVALSFAVLLISGAADMVSVVIRQTLVQLETPDAMRGRVSAVNSIFIGASNQLGEFESGATAAWLGPVGSVLLGGAGVLLIAGLWIRVFPTLWRRDRLDAV